MYMYVIIQNLWVRQFVRVSGPTAGTTGDQPRLGHVH